MIKTNLSKWNTFYLPNRFRVFLFKFYNNCLGTGNRVAHFDPGAEVQCIFCVKAGSLPAPIETIKHVFFECPHVNNIVERFHKKYFNSAFNRDNYFQGNYSENDRENRGASLIMDMLRFSIWSFRLTKRNLSFASIELETLDYIEQAGNVSAKFYQSINLNSLISADGSAAGQGGAGEEEEAGAGRAGASPNGRGRRGPGQHNTP